MIGFAVSLGIMSIILVLVAHHSFKKMKFHNREALRLEENPLVPIGHIDKKTSLAIIEGEVMPGKLIKEPIRGEQVAFYNIHIYRRLPKKKRTSEFPRYKKVLEKRVGETLLIREKTGVAAINMTGATYMLHPAVTESYLLRRHYQAFEKKGDKLDEEIVALIEQAKCRIRSLMGLGSFRSFLVRQLAVKPRDKLLVMGFPNFVSFAKDGAGARFEPGQNKNPYYVTDQEKDTLIQIIRKRAKTNRLSGILLSILSFLFLAGSAILIALSFS